MKLKDSADQNLVNDAAFVLLDQAKLFDGIELDDTAGFITKLNRIITKEIEYLEIFKLQTDNYLNYNHIKHSYKQYGENCILCKEKWDSNKHFI